MILVPGDTHVLILRVWREPSHPDGSGPWRLTLEFVGTDREESFADPGDVHAILDPILSRVVDAPVALTARWE